MASKRDYPRAARFNTELRAVLTEILRAGVIRDPRVGGTDLTVTSVEVTPDLGNAQVWVSSLASDAQLEEAVKGLNHAAGKLRHELGQRLQVRHLPALRFTTDQATRDGDRLTALIRSAVAEDQEHARVRGEAPDPT